MRPIMMCLALLLAACSAARSVDTTAVYVREAPSAPITVKAAANGDARVEAGADVFIRKDGVEYVVLHDRQGSYTVRKDDLLDVMAEQPRLAALIAPHAQPEYVLSPGAAETVAGVKGTVWRMHPKDIPSLTAIDAVIADAPALDNVGKALTMHLDFMILRNGVPRGGLGNFEKGMLALARKGTVLRFGTALRLDRIVKAPIPASAFDLPRPLLNKAELLTRMRPATS